jgi:nucleotide-binding universal stress UspA family protein
MGVVQQPRRPQRAAGYRRILVTVPGDQEHDLGVSLACGLAADGAVVRLVAVVDVPELLPLDARMRAEDRAARRLLDQARNLAERYAVHVTTAVVHAREPGSALAEAARDFRADLLVLETAPAGRRPLARAVEHALRAAPCRVVVVQRPR